MTCEHPATIGPVMLTEITDAGESTSVVTICLACEEPVPAREVATVEAER